MVISQITILPGYLAETEAAAEAVLSMSRLTTCEAKGTPALSADCLPLMLYRKR